MRNNVQNDIDEIIKLLFISRLNCQNMHWNYVGENFIEIHKYADSNIEIIDKYIDLIMEDLKQNNLFVNHPLSYINEYLDEVSNGNFVGVNPDKIVSEYYNNIDELIDLIMENNYDLHVTLENILEELMSELGKIRWFLRATFNDLISL